MISATGSTSTLAVKSLTRCCSRVCGGAAAYSTEAAAATAPSAAIPTALRGPSLRAALLLSRPPRILREPSKLESAYFEYNSHLRAYLSQPFTPDFYFKKGSSAEGRFEAAERERIAARARTGMAKAGSSSSKKGDGQPAMVQSAAEAELYATLPRTTKADESNDITSLERKLDRTLYLFVRSTDADKKEEGWRLPEQVISRKPGKYGASNEHLHEAAVSAVTSQLGKKMDIWVVSNLPVAVTPRPSDRSDPASSIKTYTLAAHILSGAPAAAIAKESNLEFVWLTKEEARSRVEENKQGASRWQDIEVLLSE